jgi:RsiW-degrading membrane proteinase PrsW (M82 family)
MQSGNARLCRAYATVAYFIAASCGFAMVESLMSVVFSSPDGAWLSLRMLAMFARSVVSLPVHVVCACYTALRVAMRDAQRAANVKAWSWPRVLWPAIAIHGTFDAVLMLLPALAVMYGSGSAGNRLAQIASAVIWGERCCPRTGLLSTLTG